MDSGLLPACFVPGLRHVSLDIGGSLVKVMTLPGSMLIDDANYGFWPLDRIQGILDAIARFVAQSKEPIAISITGGGIHKYKEQLDRLFPQYAHVDEMQSLAAGSMHLLSGNAEPYLLVNSGSGISTLLVNPTARSMVRVSGSCIGGGTFIGLARLLTRNDELTYDEAIELTTLGDGTNVDLLVKDIYGGSYPGILDLSADTVACSLGKLKGPHSINDAMTSVLNMVAISIAQQAALTAPLHHVSNIVFSGAFVRHPTAQAKVLAALDHWGYSGSMLPHQGYLGCIGAFLEHNNIKSDS